MNPRFRTNWHQFYSWYKKNYHWNGVSKIDIFITTLISHIFLCVTISFHSKSVLTTDQPTGRTMKVRIIKVIQVLSFTYKITNQAQVMQFWWVKKIIPELLWSLYEIAFKMYKQVASSHFLPWVQPSIESENERMYHYCENSSYQFESKLFLLTGLQIFSPVWNPDMDTVSNESVSCDYELFCIHRHKLLYKLSR